MTRGNWSDLTGPFIRFRCANGGALLIRASTIMSVLEVPADPDRISGGYNPSAHRRVEVEKTTWRVHDSCAAIERALAAAVNGAAAYRDTTHRGIIVAADYESTESPEPNP